MGKAEKAKFWFGREDKANSRSQNEGGRGEAGEERGKDAGTASKSRIPRRNIQRGLLGNFAFQRYVIQSVSPLSKTPSGQVYIAFKWF